MQRKYSLLMRGGVLAAALCAPSFIYADTGEKKGAPAEAREKSRDAQQPVRIEAPLPAQTITAVQQALAARNLYQGKVDGVWGAKTESALRNFQTQSNMPVTGRLDAATAERLGLAVEVQPVSGTDAPAAAPPSAPAAAPQAQSQPAATDRSPTVPLSALNKEQTRELQEELRDYGFYRGPVDGVMGESTRAALQSFFARQLELAARGQLSHAALEELFDIDADEVRIERR